MGNNNILRGKKWSDLRAKAVFEQKSKDVEWMDLQASIVNDIKEYEDSINKPKVEIKKTSKGA